jgi:peptide/nickel transport system substrate-binding protein
MKTLQQRLYKSIARIKYIIHHLTRLQRIIFVVLCITLIVGTVGTLVHLSNTTTTETSARGGSFSEGVIGTPRFINPVLATSGPDKDLTEIVYAGLMAYNGSDYITELAEDYVVSEDGTMYSFTLKDDITFHDGEPLTAHDVVFTVELVQNSSVKSPLRPQWTGVTATAVDDRTVQFLLDNPYAGFIHVTTLGILPQHILGTITPEQLSFSEFNINAVGAGPYKIKNISKDKLGIPKKISLRRNNNYALGKPNLKNISFKFFTETEEAQKALTRRTIDGLYNIATTELERFNKRSFTVHNHPLPQTFALFFNQNTQEIFLSNDVLTAIDIAIPKEAIIKRVFNRYGTPLCGPIPPHMVGSLPCEEKYLRMTVQERAETATSLLESDGWSRNNEGLLEKDGTVLEFTVALPNNPELKETAAMIETALSDVGINMEQQVFEPGNFDQDVIRPRNYEALLFGQIYEHDTDSFAFWHSSGRNDPGFNIGMYANSDADELLRNALTEPETIERRKLYTELYDIFDDDVPAVFLYTPDFIYVTRSNIYNITTQGIINPHDRLSLIHTWYKYTNRVWKPFIN